MAAASTNSSASRPIVLLSGGTVVQGVDRLPGARSRPDAGSADRQSIAQPGLGPGSRTEARHAAFGPFGAAALCTPYETTTVDGCVKDTKAYLGEAVRDAPPPPCGAGRRAPLRRRRGLLRW